MELKPVYEYSLYLWGEKRRVRTEQNGPLCFLMIPGFFLHGQFKIFFQYVISITYLL